MQKKRNPAKAHATRLGHVPKSKDEGKQPHPKAFAQPHNAAKGLYNNTGGRAIPKKPIKAGKVTTKDRKGVAKGPRPKGSP